MSRIGDNVTCQVEAASQGPDIAPIEIVRGSLVKDDRQKASIRRILERLLHRLPSFGSGAEEFVDLYPIHPQAFGVMLQLHQALPSFSVLRFIQDVIPGALDRPEEQIIATEDLFEFVLPELRKLDSFAPLISSYDNFLETLLPLFKQSARPRVTALLKGIALSTVCSSRPVDVRSLTNSLLLYEENDLVPGYSMTAALLVEMEQKGGRYLLAEGESLERSYRLLDSAAQSLSRERLENEAALGRKLPLLIYDWIRAEIPAWRPDLSPRYEVTSQALVAPFPEGERLLPGMVYFKSVNDPFWTDDDFQALAAEGHCWILVILNPMERASPTGPGLREFAAHSDRILVWHPDNPAREEIEHLERIVSSHPVLVAEGPAESSLEARNEARGILRTLYVHRGQLVTAGDQWSIGVDIEDRSLPRYLSDHLAALVSLAPGQIPETESASPSASGAVLVERRTALSLAAALAGYEDEQENLDLDSARGALLGWWDSVLATENVFSEKEGPLPDSFMTTRFMREVKPARDRIYAARPILESLRRGEAGLEEALEEILRQFGGDDARLLEWAESLRGLAGLVRWLPGFEQAKEYVLAAFPLGQEKLDQQRAALQEMIYQPHLFLQASTRETFDTDFLAFKSGYIDHYHAVHEETLNLIGASREAESKVDAPSLHNLEVLSNLLYADRSYLNRVRILAQWILRNQCLLPVREILEHYPRCYCNFNPGGNRELTKSAAQINALILEGVEYFRESLRRCSNTITDEIKVMNLDDFHSRQISALLGQGRLAPLKPGTIEALNKIIEKHPTDFLSAASFARKPEFRD